MSSSEEKAQTNLSGYITLTQAVSGYRTLVCLSKIQALTSGEADGRQVTCIWFGGNEALMFEENIEQVCLLMQEKMKSFDALETDDVSQR